MVVVERKAVSGGEGISDVGGEDVMNVECIEERGGGGGERLLEDMEAFGEREVEVGYRIVEVEKRIDFKRTVGAIGGERERDIDVWE